MILNAGWGINPTRWNGIIMLLIVFILSFALTCTSNAQTSQYNSTLISEMFYKLTFYREKRDSYYQVYMDYLSQNQEIEDSKIKLKINITKEAVETSFYELTKLKIPVEQYYQMLNNKNLQYANLLEVQRELDQLISLTDVGFIHTQNVLDDATGSTLGILFNEEKWQLSKSRKIVNSMNFTTTVGYLPSYARAHKVARIRNRVSAGRNHGLLLHFNGLLYSWGADSGGALGRPKTASNPTFTLANPVELPKNITILQFVSSNYANLVLAGDAAYSWGRNDYGVVGDGTFDGNKPPFKVFSWDLQGPKRIEQIAAGAYSFHVIDENGKVYSWGRNNRGQLGDKTLIDKPRPVDLFMKGGLLNQTVIRVCAGDGHTLFLTSKNQLFSTGDNTYGQLGIGSTVAYVMEPNLVKQINSSIVDIQCGDNFNLALTSTGKIYGWGRNNLGQLGTGDLTDRNIPTLLNFGNTTAVKIFARFSTAFALTNESYLYGWGSNSNTQLGISSGSYFTSPQNITLPNYVTVVDMALMQSSSVFLGNNGTYYGAGYSGNSELIRSTSSQSSFDWIYNGVSFFGFAMERRRYPYIEVGNVAYQFVGDNFAIFPDNGFYLYKRSVSEPTLGSIVEYRNNTGRFFQGTIYNTHMLTAGEYIYMYGGVINNTISNAIYRCKVSDLEAGWEITRFKLPYNISAGQSILVDDYFYIFGGVISLGDDSASPQLSLNVTDMILRFSVSNPLTPELLSERLPVGVYSGQIARVKDFIYIFGGRTQDPNAPYSDILRASYFKPTIFKNTYSVLPYQVTDGSLIVTENYVAIFGGFYSGMYPFSAGKYNYEIFVAPSDEPVGSWMVTDYKLPSLLRATPSIVGSTLALFGQDVRMINTFPLSNSTFTMFNCTILM